MSSFPALLTWATLDLGRPPQLMIFFRQANALSFRASKPFNIDMFRSWYKSFHLQPTSQLYTFLVSPSGFLWTWLKLPKHLLCAFSASVGHLHLELGLISLTFDQMAGAWGVSPLSWFSILSCEKSTPNVLQSLAMFLTLLVAPVLEGKSPSCWRSRIKLII